MSGVSSNTDLDSSPDSLRLGCSGWSLEGRGGGGLARKKKGQYAQVNQEQQVQKRPT